MGAMERMRHGTHGLDRAGGCPRRLAMFGSAGTMVGSVSLHPPGRRLRLVLLNHVRAEFIEVGEEFTRLVGVFPGDLERDGLLQEGE